MESQFIFKLKRPIVFPISQSDNQGVVVYNSRDFAFGYSIIPNPKEKQLTVTLLIYRVADEVVIRSIATFNITEQGFPTGVLLNQADIDAALASKVKLQDSIDKAALTLQALYAQEAALAEQGEDTSVVSATIVATSNQLLQDRLKLSTLVVPTPELEYANRYSDIIDYFNKDGSITEAGIEWAKSVPFLGLTLNDYLA